MIHLCDIDKFYGETQALRKLNLEFHSNAINVIIGPSGCGKSSCLKLLNKMESFQSGSIRIDATDIAEYDPIQLRRSIGYVIQQTGLFPHMTVFENITIIPRILKWSNDDKEQRFNDLMKLIDLNIEDYRTKYPYQLSGGEAQRVGVARALAADPDILLMDEPFGAVDPIIRSSLQEQFLLIQKQLKKTIIFVTHDIDEAILMADQLFIMRNGRLEQSGTPHEILENPANEFVSGFVGTDRAIKKLALISVEGVFKKNVPFLSPGDLIPEESKYSWICDKQGTFVGWNDTSRSHAKRVHMEAVTKLDIAQSAVTPDTRLKTALSKLISSDFKTLPVIDHDKKFLGEISIEQILKL